MVCFGLLDVRSVPRTEVRGLSNTSTSTNLKDNPEEIVRTYKIRWRIGTYHRDIKQNFGFAKIYLRKTEIFVPLEYAQNQNMKLKMLNIF